MTAKDAMPKIILQIICLVAAALFVFNFYAVGMKSFDAQLVGKPPRNALARFIPGVLAVVALIVPAIMQFHGGVDVPLLSVLAVLSFVLLLAALADVVLEFFLVDRF